MVFCQAWHVVVLFSVIGWFRFIYSCLVNCKLLVAIGWRGNVLRRSECPNIDCFSRFYFPSSFRYVFAFCRMFFEGFVLWSTTWDLIVTLSLSFLGKFWRNFDLGPKSISNWYPIFRSISDFNVYDWLIVTTFTDFGLYLFSSNVYFLVIARRSSRSMSVSIGMSWARAWMYNGVMIGVDG